MKPDRAMTLENTSNRQVRSDQGTGSQRRYRLAILASHVIQYQGPLFKAFSSHPDLEIQVFFCSDWGANSYRDPGFGRDVKWDMDLLQGYEFEFLPNVSPCANLSSFWSTINPQIVSRLRKAQYDALLVHGWARCTNWIAFAAALLLGIPVILRGETNLLNPKPLWKRILKRAVLVPLFKRVRGFLAIGSDNASFYRSFGVSEQRIFLAPYAVNNDFFTASADKLQSTRKGSGKHPEIQSDLPIILFCGKLSDVKRPLDLLNAFEQLQSQASLVFVGDGPLKRTIQEHVERRKVSNVHFAGFINQSELPKFYAMADIFVLPSEEEPWGLVVNEAMCYSLPLIITDRVGAGADLVRNGENGFIYPCGDVQQLANLLSTLIHDSVKRKQMGENSRALIEHWGYAEDTEALIKCLATFVPKNR